jgi:hypothetical protein
MVLLFWRKQVEKKIGMMDFEPIKYYNINITAKADASPCFLTVAAVAAIIIRVPWVT